MRLSLLQVEQIEAICGIPFYLFDIKAFRQNYFDLKNAFIRHYPPTILAYSLKTNYLPLACKIIKEEGGYAEVVSSLEYSLALKLGYPPERVIFNGPVKHYDSLHAALAGRTLVNFDSPYELEYIDRYISSTSDRDFNLGLRINIDLSSKSQPHDCCNHVGRFGFPPDSLNDVVRFLEDRGIRIRSLHGHCSSDRSLENFELITSLLCQVRDEYHLNDIQYVDIGGGFFGKVPKDFYPHKVPAFSDYAECVVSILKRNRWINTHRPNLVLEPGVAIVADATSFISRVWEIKNIKHKRFAIVDGSALHMKPTMHHRNLPFHHISCSTERTVSEGGKFDVVGSTCMERDVLLEDVNIPGLRRGDYLQIDNAGAYTVVLSPPFINPAPPIVAIDNGKIFMARRNQTLDDFLCCYDF